MRQNQNRQCVQKHSSDLTKVISLWPSEKSSCMNSNAFEFSKSDCCTIVSMLFIRDEWMLVHVCSMFFRQPRRQPTAPESMCYQCTVGLVVIVRDETIKVFAVVCAAYVLAPRPSASTIAVCERRPTQTRDDPQNKEAKECRLHPDHFEMQAHIQTVHTRRGSTH